MIYRVKIKKQVKYDFYRIAIKQINMYDELTISDNVVPKSKTDIRIKNQI